MTCAGHLTVATSSLAQWTTVPLPGIHRKVRTVQLASGTPKQGLVLFKVGSLPW